MSKKGLNDQQKTTNNEESPEPTSEMRQPVSEEERYAKIAETAYFLAEQRCFQGDLALDDWLRAEAEINARMSGTE